MISIDRKNPEKARKSIDKAGISLLDSNFSTIIYPEGTRSDSRVLLPFKKGGLIMALIMGIPVVPIAMCGTRESMQTNKLKLSKIPLELRIGKPIETLGLDYEKRNDFVKKVRDSISTLKAEWQEDIYNKA